MKGKFDYGTGRVVEIARSKCASGRTTRPYPFQSHDLWFLNRGYPLGQIRSGLRHQGADRPSQSRGPLEKKPQRISALPHQHSASRVARQETFFDGKVFDPEIRGRI